jgi:hypothetical protein
MVRARKPPGPADQGGYGALPLDQSVPSGGKYGDRQRVEASVRDQPLPDAGRDPMAGAEAAALAMPTPAEGLLAPPPGPEPLTAGLPMGPGPGPEALGLPTGRVSAILREVAEVTGDALVASVAAEAEARRL